MSILKKLKTVSYFSTKFIIIKKNDIPTFIFCYLDFLTVY